MKHTALPETMDCIVVGGCADGLYLRNVRTDAEGIELSRAMFMKPLVSPTQEQPDIEKEKDRYRIHPIVMQNGRVQVLGIAVIENKPLPWALKQLILSYVEKAVRKMKDQAQQHALVHH